MGHKWHQRARVALEHSNWSVTPQVRVIQHMLLSAVYINPDHSRDTTASFFILLSTAIRLCQMLNFHRLGSDPHTMPPDDVAFPPGPSSLKREMAKRLLYFCLSFDWMNCLMSGINQLTPENCASFRLSLAPI